MTNLAIKFLSLELSSVLLFHTLYSEICRSQAQEDFYFLIAGALDFGLAAGVSEKQLNSLI